MEDSYTVHRRRKAAARKREKTPEPPRRRQGDVTETDEDEDARARMERMVRETEMLEELDEKRRANSEKSGDDVAKATIVDERRQQRALNRAMSPEVDRREEENRGKSLVEVSKREKSEKCEKMENLVETNDASRQVENATEVRLEESPKKSSKDDGSILKNRRDPPPRDLSPPKMGESGASNSAGKKKLGSVEKSEEIRSKEGNGEEARNRNIGNSRKTFSRPLDEVERNEAETKILDENRHEASVASVPRDKYTEDSSISGRSGKSLKHERREAPASTKNREIKEKSVERAGEEKIQREITSVSKARTSEGRSGTKTSAKRSSKDRLEKTGYTTDSSETEETARRLLRRKKSPEGAKLRSSSGKIKTASRSRPTTDTEADEQQQDERKRIDKKIIPRRRRSSESEDEDLHLKERPRSPTTRDKRELGPRAPPRQVEKAKNVKKPTRYSSDLSDDCAMTMSHSETFPLDKTASEKSPSRSKSSSEIKKQIIPLSDDSLIEDFQRAQLHYLQKERSIFDPDPLDDYVDPRMAAALRQRKFSAIQTDEDVKLIDAKIQRGETRSWFSWVPFFGKRAKKDKVEDKHETTESSNKSEEISCRSLTTKSSVTKKSSENLQDPKIHEKDTTVRKKVSFVEFFRTLADFAAEFRAFVDQNPREIRKIRVLKNRCLVELLFAIIYCGLGAFVFRFTEGAFETFYKCGVKRVKRDFLDSLWNFSHNMREEDWKSMARRKLMEFEEQLHTAHEAGVHSYSGQKSWSFLNAVLYCLTVITTIGYGHISPSTTTGRAITIVYAIFGIPMFLIILADFGKLFTRGIKFLWAFVRRVYYTGSCRRVRRTVPVQEVMKGVQLVYDLATFRRPSQMNPEEIEELEKQQNQAQTVLNLDGNAPASAQVHTPGTPGTPGTPALSTFAIDDEFNLPISVAIIILLVYIFVGATAYNFWEQWGFFESFYFVFISMSTIGFGDYVPKHPIYMMLSIVYLVFGLALTSMCINVVQVMLSDSFRQASQKIGATIGFEVNEEDGSIHLAASPPVEVVDVHTTIKESESEEQVAPRAKQEDLEL